MDASYFWSYLFGVQMPPVLRWAHFFYLDLGNCLIKIFERIFSAFSTKFFFFLHACNSQNWSFRVFCRSHTFSSIIFCYCLSSPDLLFYLQTYDSVLPMIHSIDDALQSFLFPVFQLGFPPPVCLLLY